MATSTITNRQALNSAIQAVLAANANSYDFERDEVVGKLTKMIEALDRKASAPKTPSASDLKKRAENDGFKAVIATALKKLNGPSTIADLKTADATLAGLSTPKIAALLTQMVTNGTIKRKYEGKVTVYCDPSVTVL